MFTLVIVGFLSIYIMANVSQNKYGAMELNKGWSVRINQGDIHENVDLDVFRAPRVKRGDWFVLKSKLPDEIPNESSVLIKIPYSVVSVYIDNEEVFSYGTDDYDTGKLIGSGKFFFILPDDADGKNIKITMLVTEDSAFSTIETPVIYESLHGLETYHRERLLPFTVSLSLIITGFAVTIVTFAMYFRSFSLERLLCIGLFSLCIGCWTLCSYDLNFIFTDNLRLKSYLEYFALYISPLPILMYFREDVEKRGHTWEIRLYFGVVFVLIQLFLVVAGLNCFNIVHFPKFFDFYLGVIVACIIYSVVLIVRDVSSEHKHHRLIWGVAALLVFCFRDIASYILYNYTDLLGKRKSFNSYTAAGAFAFILAMMADFIIEIRRNTYVEAENELLTKLAYNDVLTGLSTRRKIEELFKSIDSSDKEFAIIQFDLNNLKMVNDNLGHEMGDRLIVKFADLLKRNYDRGEYLGRMGGDEFVVVIPDVTDYELDTTLDRLNKLVEDANSLSDDLKVSFSCGHCYSYEIHKATATAVYVEADRRMYLEKEKYYKARGYGRRQGDRA